MYVYCVYPAMSKKSENLSDLTKKDRNKRHSSPFINVVKGVFFVVRVTVVPVSYLSAPSAVHSYGVPGKFIRIAYSYSKYLHGSKVGKGVGLGVGVSPLGTCGDTVVTVPVPVIDVVWW